MGMENLKSTISVLVCVSFFVLIPLEISAAVLTHGPVVGGVGANEAKVFVRTDQSASVKIQYSTSPDFTSYNFSDTFRTSSTTSFTLITSLTCLTPQTTYYLNVYVNEVPQFLSSYPSFTTFPETTDPQSFKFIILSDFINVKNSTKIWLTFLHAAREEAAFAFIGGDFDHRNPATLWAKRQMFKQLYDPSSSGLYDFVNSILRKMPIVHQWDDHDAGGNNCDKNYPYWNLSNQVFKEYVPAYDLPSGTYGIWQYFRYAHVDFFILDGRSQRGPDISPDGPNKSMLDGNHLGANGQLEWIKQGLMKSTARWKIIFSSVVTNPTTKLDDGWAAFKTEWSNLRNFINNNNIGGVVFISGDLHIGGIDNGNASGFPEMVVPGTNLEPMPGKKCSSGSPGIWSEGIYFNPSGPCNGYGVVTVLTDPDRSLLEIKDENGNTQVSHVVF